ncbi:hypothetical protein FD754_001992 [Muntiacus muntjak]|uniref:BTB domain-containing protein n=1 Tax=Muntiacus muntjak TaxID=9888 RepID=A0A5N3WBX0_MUNMU|nr:hypothetical protein FD754_001992 [Muntiacus muntjak]
MSRSGDRTSTFDPSHSDNLLHGLNLLWRKQLFCDVTLTAQGQQFHCHKAVLASCSQYFRSLFSSHPPLGGGVGGQDGLGAPKDPPQQPPQQQQPPPPAQEEPGTPSSSPDDKLVTSPRAINNLVLQGCSSIGLRLVLEYLYTANVTLSLDTVEEVLSVSKILHIPQVTKLCVQFLNDQISVQNYKQVCKIAALHGLEETKKLANKYLVEDVLLLNFEEMRALLDSLPPPVESELALFQMSVLWLEHDRETRMQYAPDLMKRLRFALIPAPELVERVQSVDFMRTDPVCQKLLLDAMNYHLMPFRQHCRQSLASSHKGVGELLLLLFGMCPVCVLKVGFPAQGEREKQCLFKMLLRLKRKKKKRLPRRGLLSLFRKEAVSSSQFLRIKHRESRCQVPQSHPLSVVLESTWFNSEGCLEDGVCFLHPYRIKGLFFPS